MNHFGNGLEWPKVLYSSLCLGQIKSRLSHFFAKNRTSILFPHLADLGSVLSERKDQDYFLSDLFKNKNTERKLLEENISFSQHM